MISIVIPLYNKEKQIASTLRSVFAQTYTDYEIVIVDDGSTDGSAAVVESFHDPRIRLIHQANAGVSAARNLGISEARGEYIAMLDADDLWKPEFLKTIVGLIDKYPQCDVFATKYNFVDEFGNYKDSVINKIKFKNQDGIINNYFEIACCSDSPINSSIVAFSKTAITNIGKFPIGITSGEDLLTWAKLACSYKIAYSKTIGATYYTPTTGPTGIVPKDLTTTKDAVGCALQQLAKEYPNIGIEKYIAYWYKMRGVINIRRGNRMATFKCACKSISYNPFLVKSWVLTMLSVSPMLFIKKIMR